MLTRVCIYIYTYTQLADEHYVHACMRAARIMGVDRRGRLVAPNGIYAPPPDR